jgi:hypothetical protein
MTYTCSATGVQVHDFGDGTNADVHSSRADVDSPSPVNFGGVCLGIGLGFRIAGETAVVINLRGSVQYMVV